MDATRFFRPAVGGMLLAFLASAAVGGNRERDESTTDILTTYAAFLNEVSARRRRAVYFANPQSLFDGAAVGPVNAGSGNLTFARRDLVVAAPMPIVVARVYDSRDSGGGDFGAGGWRLSLAERIETRDGVPFTYVTSASVRLPLVADGERYVPARPQPGDFLALDFVQDGVFQARFRSGQRRRFERHGDLYRLAIVTDRFDNRLDLSYDHSSRLQRVEGADGAFVSIRRDARGRIVAIEDDAGRTVRYAYDSAGRLEIAVGTGGSRWRYDYTADNRLAAALAAGGELDIAVEWTGDGRVGAVLADGVQRRFRYTLATPDLPGLSLTEIDDAAGRRLTLGQNRDGVTVYARRPDGAVTSVALDPAQRVRALYRGDSRIAHYEYDARGRVVRAGQPDASSVMRELVIAYEADGRLRRIVDDSGQVLVEHSWSGDGRVLTVRDERDDRVLEFGPDGLVTRFATGTATDLRLTRDGRGRIVRVADDAGRISELSWSDDSRLDGIRFPDGQATRYDHDAAGLRLAAVREHGGALRFGYTPSGTLAHFRRESPSGAAQTAAFQLDGSARVGRVVVDETIYRFRYRGDGELAAVDWAGNTLEFAYDTAGRFIGVRLGNGEWLEYRYEPMEHDLRTRVDTATRIASRARVDSDLTFADYDSVALDRSRATLYGPVWFDAVSGIFRPAFDWAVPRPEKAVMEILVRIRFLGADGRGTLPAAAVDDAYGRFNAASNPFFVPPEYRSLNCLFCPPSLPFAIPLGGTAKADGPRIASLVQIATSLERCSIAWPEPPSDCSLAVSGLPPYLCNLRQAQIGATLTPAGPDPDNIAWVVGGALVQVPVGDGGPTTGVRGASTVNADGSIRASYASGDWVCQSPTLALPVRANEVQTFAQVISLDACPERQHDLDELHVIDGCSIPPVTALIFPGDTQDPVGGQLNVAGTSTAFGAPQSPVAHDNPPLPLPCNRHDVCYQTCGQAQLGCDNAMLSDMYGVCATAYPPNCPYGNDWDTCEAYFDEQVACSDIADVIFDALHLFGVSSWQQRQVQYCNCCPP